MSSWLLWASVSAIVVSALAAVSLRGCTSLGAQPSGERLSRMRDSPHWSEGRFTNEQPMWVNTRSGLLRSLDSAPAEVPDTPVSVVMDGGKGLRSTPASGLRVTWFGHSSVLVEIDGVTVLTDPLWSERASPVSWAGPKRWYPAPIALRELPRIDVVLISHDHYDHLDRPTIAAMTNWDATFVVPLGVGAHLERWGIAAARIVELDWWQSARVGSLRSSPRLHVMPQDEPRRKVTARYGPDTRYSARSIAHGIPVIRDFILRWRRSAGASDRSTSR